MYFLQKVQSQQQQNKQKPLKSLPEPGIKPKTVGTAVRRVATAIKSADRVDWSQAI